MYRQQVELRKQLIKRSNKPWNPIAINHMIIETFFFFILLVKHLIYRTYIKKITKTKAESKKSSDSHDGFFLYIRFDANVGRISLQDLSTYLKALNVSFGFEVIVRQSVPY